MPATIALSLAALLANPPLAAESQRENYDATAVEYGHGFLVVRSFKDCREHFLSAPISPRGASANQRNDDQGLEEELRRRGNDHGNVHVWVSNDKGLETVLSIDSSDRKDSAQEKCVKVLGTKKAEGVVTEISSGSGGDAFTLLGDHGDSIKFFWRGSQWPTFDGQPDKGGVAFANLRNGVTKVRVSYELLQDGPSKRLRVIDIAVLP